MAGYIGSKAVLLSTTAATVTGNASIGGNLTLGGNIDVSSGTIKLDGNYPVGTGNVALGDAALDSNQSGANNTAIGADALTANTASNNTAVGYQAGYSNTTGDANVYIGRLSGANGTTARFNTFVGDEAGGLITSGQQNVYMGNDTGYSTTTGSYNVALGASALVSNTTASKNTALGYQAGYVNTTGYENVFVGYQSGYNNTGYGNNYIGYGAGVLMTSGNANTILGKFSGNQGGLDIRTSNNNIVLSDGDGNPLYRGQMVSGDPINRFMYPGTNAWAYGSARLVVQDRNSNFVQWYYGTSQVGSITTNGSSTSYNTTSDYRLKENIVELTSATDRIKQIPVHRFNFTVDPNTTVDGFLAHEVQAVVPEAVTGTKDEVDADGNPVYQGIDQSKLVPLLVATIKELEARIAALEAN